MSCDIEATIDQRPIDVEVQGAIVAMDLADGDYGDIAVSNNGATMTIENMGENATVTTGTYASKVNQDLLIKVRKASAGTITKGQVVYIVGSTGNHLSVELARADAEATSAYTIGIAATTITNTTDGFVIQNGRLTGLSTLPTANFADGDAIYLSETTAGAYRVGLPQAPNHGVFLGFVIKANNGNAGEIDIRIDNYQELEELSDVYINNETANDFLMRNNTNTRWENTTPANVKTILAINNVDNTSDANKPISTATQTALNAKVNKSGDTMTGALVNSTNGAVSTPPMSLTGSWYSGGTSTNTKPQLLIEPTGTTSTSWSTAGTGLGVNAPSGFTGNLATFGINGTERMRITASGNVGIGTTTPGVLLEVNGAMTAQGNIFAASGGATRTITLGPAGAGLEYNIDGTTYLGGRTDAYPLVFRTNNTERVRITSGGTVGIGTASPATNLDIAGGLRVVADQNTTGISSNILLDGSPNAISTLLFRQNAGDTQRGFVRINATAANNVQMEFGTANTVRMVVGGNALNGSVGIGTASPLAKLEVKGSTLISTTSNGNNILGFNDVAFVGGTLTGAPDGASGSAFIVGNGSTGAGAPSYLSMWTTNGGVVSERMRITAAGNVGIGTTSPGDKLEVNNGGIVAGNAVNNFRIVVSRTGANPSSLVMGAFTDSPAIEFTGALGLRFLAGLGGTEVMRIRNNNLGIGTVDPSVKLHVDGQIRTAAPTGGTAANWRLGTVHTVTPTSPNRTIEVDIGGTIYYIHAKTTNN